MNFKLITWLYVVFVTQTEGVRNGNQTLLEKEDTCDDDSSQITCSKDCSSLKVCYASKVPPITLPCPADTPFCANGKCGTVNQSCEMNLNDDDDSQNFVCTSDGIFPDPTNCSNWFVCDGTTVTKVSCNSGYIFNSKTYECVRGTPRTDHASKNICRKISCNKKKNGYILFPANPAYYAYCNNGSMLLYKCSDVENQIYDISSKKCVFKCKSAGYFPDPLNCTIYYFCKSFVKKFKATTLYCAAGHYFNGTACVIGTDCGSTPSPTIPTPPTPTTEDTTTSDVPTPPTATTESTTFTSIPFPTTESTTTDVPTPPTASSTEPPTSTSTTTTTRPTPPTPTTEDPTTTDAESTTFTSIPFPTTESTTTDVPSPPTASTTEPPTSTSTTTTTRPTPPTPTTEDPTTTDAESTTFTSIPFPTTESTTTDVPTPPTASTTEPPTSTSTTTTTRPTPPTPTTEDPTTTNTSTPPTVTTESTTFTSIPFPTTESTTTDVPSPPTASTTEPPTSTTRPTPPTRPTVQIFLNPIDQQETTRSPNFYQSFSLWKHKGKYSIRLS